jgi:uncharacterized phage-associated protein
MTKTPTVFDVSKYILEKNGAMTHMKLQKLVYYSQAWSLVWDEQQLFEEKIEAWINGPVVPVLFQSLKGSFLVSSDSVPGNSTNLNQVQKETVDSVLDFYGGFSSQYLSDLTHLEAPWKQARSGISEHLRGNGEITASMMANYYGGLDVS